jgi:hypothetical protein
VKEGVQYKIARIGQETVEIRNKVLSVGEARLAVASLSRGSFARPPAADRIMQIRHLVKREASEEGGGAAFEDRTLDHVVIEEATDR